MRDRALSDPRAAEVLLRWLQRSRAEDRVGGVDLDSMPERELERLYAGLLRRLMASGRVDLDRLTFRSPRLSQTRA